MFFNNLLLVKCSNYSNTVSLVLWFVSLELIVLDRNTCLKVGLMLSYIKLNTVYQYFSNPKADITTTQNILLFIIMMCSIVLFFDATNPIEFFIKCFCVSNTCRDYFRTLSAWNLKIVFLGGCRAGCNFICYWDIPCLILMLLPWSTTLFCNVHYYWTCVQ